MRYLPLLSLISLLAVLCLISPVHAAPGNLAYIHNDQLYIKVLPDGKPIRLTNDTNARRPRWSHSGCWIAYKANDRLQIVHISGKPAYTIKDMADLDSYSWSPSADRLAYIAKGRSLRILGPSTKGLNGRTIVSNKGQGETTGVASFAWSPDGRQIAYTFVSKAAKSNANQTPPGLASSVRKINSDGSGVKTLLDAGANTYLPIIARWSPDGKWILYWRDDMYSASLMADGVPLEVVPSAGGKPRQLLQSMLAYRDFFSFAPEGSVFAASAGNNRFAWTGKRLVKVDIKSGAKKTLTSANELAISPSWSSTGDKIAYVSAPDQPDLEDTSKVSLSSRDINVIDPQTGTSKQISKNKLCRYEYPRWSLDGSQLMLVRIDKQNKAIAWIVKHDGSSPAEASEELGPDRNGWSGYYGYVDWSEYIDWWQPQKLPVTSKQ